MVTTTTGLATSFIQFTRASNATVTDSNGNIEWAGHNLLTNSESFDATAWGKGDVTVSANSTVAPNGTSTADTIVEDADFNLHYVAQSISTIASVQYTASAFIKAGTQTFCIISVFSNSTTSLYAAASFNLSTGAVVNSGASGTGYAIVGTPTITPVGSGWYQCSVTFTNGTTGANFFGVALSDDGTISDFGLSLSYLGASKTIYAWGAHLYRSDLGGMVLNPSRGDAYYPTTPPNLLGFTENITVAPWFEDDVTRASNVAIAPNGLQTADSITDNTATSAHLISQIQAVNAGPKTVSIYAKANTWNFIQLSFGSAVTGRANFDVTNGVAGSTDHTSSITSVGNGWYRCSVTLTTTAANLEIYVGLITSNTAAGLESYAGTGVRSVYLWGAQISDSASLDTYSPVYGAAVTSAAYYAPRLDFDPVTLAAKGLLVEEQRTNLVLNSATLSTQNVTVTAVAHTLSFYGTGTVTLSGVSTAGPLVGTGAYPNRVTLTFTPTAGTLTLTVTGSVTQAQLEDNASFATSYIPTGAAPATRSADVASVSTQAFPYSATEGSLVASFTPVNVAAARRAAQLDDATENERITLGTNSTPNGLMTVIDGGSSQASIATGTPAANTTMKLASRYKLDDFAVSANGAAVGTDTSGTLPTVTTLRLGSGTSSTEPLNGWLRQITYLPRALTNAELQSRSA